MVQETTLVILGPIVLLAEWSFQDHCLVPQYDTREQYSIGHAGLLEFGLSCAPPHSLGHLPDPLPKASR